MSQRSVALSALITAATLGLLPATSSATYPGQNGAIAYGVAKYDKKATDPTAAKPGAIYSILGDGSQGTALTDDRTYDDFEPQWSPDGKRIAYASVVGGDWDGIYVMSPGSEKFTRITKATSPDSPTWAPDGKSLIFVDYAKGLYSTPAKARSTSTLLLKHSKAWYVVAPAYAPDGKTVLFVKEKNTTTASKYKTEIWAMDPSGGNPRAVLTDAAGVSHPHLPDVSPDSTRMVFEGGAAVSDRSSIFTARLDGTELRQVVAAPSGQFFTSATWSPDGTKIAATLMAGPVKQGSSLVTIDVPTGAITTVRKASKAYLINPSWQPLPAATPAG